MTSLQALKDAAAFVRWTNQQNNLTSPKWVVFGGSYSGSLALWFRQRYPELTVGAVGSSAPMEFVVDFYGKPKKILEVLCGHLKIYVILREIKKTENY